MSGRVGHLPELAENLVVGGIAFFAELLWGLIAGLVETDVQVGSRPVGWSDRDGSAEDGPPAEFEVNPLNRFPLAYDDVEAGWRRPVLVLDVDGIRFARADPQLVGSVSGRANMVLPILHTLAAAVSVDLDARRR